MIQRIKNKVKVLRTDPHMQEVARGTMLAFALKIVGSSLAFGFNVAVARLLGAEGAGLYFLALSVTAIGSVIGRVGLDNALLRFVATHAARGEWGKVQAVHALGMRLAVIVSGVLSLFGFFAAGWMAETLFQKPELAEPLRWMSLSILPFAILNLQAESLKGLKRLREAMLLQSIGVPLIGLLLIWSLASIAGVEGVSWGYLVATTMVALLGIWAWRSACGGDAEDASRYPFVDLWVSAKPLFIIALMNTSLTWLPMLVLGVWVSAAEVGVFGAANRLALLVSFLLVTLNNVVAPKFAELHAKDDLKAMGQLARRSAAMLTLLASPLFLLLFIFSEKIMGLFGPEFASGGTVLAILLVGQVINVYTGSVRFLLIMSGNEKTIRNIIIISALLQLALVMTLVPLIGIIGAAIATVSALITMNLTSVYAVYRKLGVITTPGLQAFLRGK
tara:strand:+ start:2042 stop:3382 length:1341 start_codon:yes stop_codon:yes gene_type:complete